MESRAHETTAASCAARLATAPWPRPGAVAAMRRARRPHGPFFGAFVSGGAWVGFSGSRCRGAWYAPRAWASVPPGAPGSGTARGHSRPHHLVTEESESSGEPRFDSWLHPPRSRYFPLRCKLESRSSYQCRPGGNNPRIAQRTDLVVLCHRPAGEANLNADDGNSETGKMGGKAMT
jgi:hypothetical protein